MLSTELTLIETLGNPALLSHTTPEHQTQILRQARQTGLLGYLAARSHPTAEDNKLTDHLLSAKVHADFHDRMITWETNRLARALDTLSGPIILLKGAAYKALQLDFSKGRLASDVDILLPREQLLQAERILLAAGWEHIKQDDYEQHYYREWMHELPPLRHQERGTIADLHHNILPSTARLKPDVVKLISAAQPMCGSRFHTLSAEDSILHRAAHLFYDGDLQNGLRELVDIHELISEYVNEEGFWKRLILRSRELNLARPLYYALHFCHSLLNTGIPNAVLQDSIKDAPVYPISSLMLTLIGKQLHPADPDSKESFRSLAGWVLFLRSHWLRMPPLMLLRHLLTQAWHRGGIKTG